MLRFRFKNQGCEGSKGFTFSLRSLALSLFFIFCLLNANTLFAATITLSWDPPVSNNDGTPYANLSGYKIYYGTSSGNYSQSIDVSNVVTYTLNNFTDGVTYYIVTTAYNTSNIETPYSNEIHCLNTTSSCVGGGGGSGGGGGGGSQSNSASADISGGGCGFIKDSGGRGQWSNSRLQLSDFSLVIFFLLLLFLKLKPRKIKINLENTMA